MRSAAFSPRSRTLTYANFHRSTTSSVLDLDEEVEDDEMSRAAARNSDAISSGRPPPPSSNCFVSDNFRRPMDWGCLESAEARTSLCVSSSSS